VGRICDIAKKNRRPVILIAGDITRDARRFYDGKVIGLFSIRRGRMPLEYAIANAPRLLEELSFSIGKAVIDR
jgi:glycerate kinase